MKRHSRRHCRGQVFPVLAVMSTVIFGFAALGIDSSSDQAAQIQTQAASDASGVSASRVWSAEISSKSYTGAPPFQSGCNTYDVVCTIDTTSVDPTVFEAAQVAKLDNISALNLTQACVFSVGDGHGNGSLHVAFYGTTVSSSNCPTVPSGFSAERLDIYIPPLNPPSICSPTWRCIEADTSDVNQTQGLAGVIGASSVKVGSDSTVYAPPATVSTALPCGACLLGTTGTTVTDSGSGNFTVVNGAILTNSTATPAVVGQDNGGTISSTGTGAGIDIATGGTLSCFSCVPSTSTSVSPITDPYSQLPAPAVSGTATAFSCSGGNHTITPGVYTSISIGGGCNLSMDAGVYVIEGPMSMTGSGSDTSVATTTNGVMLYFTCSGYSVTNTSPCNSGTSYTCSTNGLSITGDAQLNLTAPTTGTYMGMGVFYDRNLNSQICLSGNSAPSMGTVYAKSSDVTVTGNGGTQSAIVTKSVTISGSGSLSINGTVNSGVAPLDNGSTSGPSFSEIAG
jgi:hypothetical protein